MPIGVSYDPITETVRYTHTHTHSHKTGFRAVTSEMTEREREVDKTVRGGGREGRTDMCDDSYQFQESNARKFWKSRTEFRHVSQEGRVKQWWEGRQQ